MNIQLFFTIWLLGVIALSFIKLKWSIALFLAYLMLVPYINLGIPGLGTGDNLIKLILVVAYYFEAKRKGKRFSATPYVPFIIYFLVSLAMIPFQDGVPTGIMLNSWRQDVMNILFLPLVMWNVMRIDSSSVVFFRNTMLVCITISISYGLLLTQLNGVNPYTFYMLTYLDPNQDFESYYEAVGTGRLFGRISSVYIHPMAFAFFIGLSFIYLFYIINDTKKWIPIILMPATLLMAVLCGVRSVLGGLIVAALFYFVFGKRIKMLMVTLAVSVLCLSVISLIPELYDYVASIIDINNEQGAVKGSSVEMRLTQLDGAIMEASRNPLFGLGYNWTTYYQGLYGDHPICLAFESLLFVVICNSGLLGILLWTFMVIRYFFVTHSLKLYQTIIVNSLIIFYISYSLITGEYSYMKTFLIFYTLILGESLKYNNNSVRYGKTSKSNSILSASISSNSRK